MKAASDGAVRVEQKAQAKRAALARLSPEERARREEVRRRQEEEQLISAQVQSYARLRKSAGSVTSSEAVKSTMALIRHRAKAEAVAQQQRSLSAGSLLFAERALV